MNKTSFFMVFSNFVRNLLYQKESICVSVRFFRHLIIGGTGTLLHMGFVALLVEWMRVPPTLAVAVSMIFLGIYLYALNRKWTYDSRIENGKSIPRFFIAGIVALLLNTGIMYFAVNVMGWWYVWGLFSSIIIVPPTNFLINYFWVFSQSREALFQ